MANGPGHPNGSVVAPAEVDTPFATGQSIWWWSPHQTFKSLRELQIEYDNSVGKLLRTQPMFWMIMIVVPY
jgi:hypothetical protein